MFGRFLIAGKPVVGIINVDFSTLSSGGMTAGSFLTNTGLTFTRSTVSTVQTSSQALDVTPGVDYACVGSSDGIKKGLVIQQNTRNRLGFGSSGNTMPRVYTSGWTAGTAAVTSNYALGPDGTNNGTRIVASSNQFSPYYSRGESPSCVSSWQKSTSKSLVWATSVNTAGAVAVGSGTSNWERLFISGDPTVPGGVQIPVDCRNWAAVPPGTSPAARDVIIDYFQYELGGFPTECIITGDTYRAPDILTYTSGSSLITSDGRIRFYCGIYPKFTSTMSVQYDGPSAVSSASDMYLFSWGTTSYAKISNSDRKLRVKISAGVEATSTNAVSFTQYDLLEFYISVGSSTTSVAKYRINGGAWSSLILSNISDVPAPPGAIQFFSNSNGTIGGDNGGFPCWVKSLICYKTTDAEP